MVGTLVALVARAACLMAADLPPEIAELVADAPPPSNSDKGARIKTLPYDDKAGRRARLAGAIERVVHKRLKEVAKGEAKLDGNTRALAQMIGVDLDLLRGPQSTQERSLPSAYATGKNAKHRGRGVRADMERQDEATEAAAGELAALLTSSKRRRKASAMQQDASSQVEAEAE